MIRLLSALLSLLLFFSGSPALLAMTAREAMVGAGGKGGAANLLNAGAATAALTAANAMATLNKTTTAVAAMQAMQASARSIVSSGGVQNGLANGWLEPWVSAAQNGVSVNGTPNTANWSGASITSPNGANNVVITQTTQNAYLYWKNFNVGPQTSLNFNQSAGGNSAPTWIAFNKVMGTANPTQILGSISAQGQVYILNQNGILFGHGSQVNTHALVASTLPINENLAGDSLDGIKAQGIVNNPDYQFLFSAVPIAAGSVGPTAAFNPSTTAVAKSLVGISTSIGNVIVQSGASITAPANAEHTGGLVALIGPNVYNAGSISTPNGQTILAAGLQVGLNPHPSSDPSLRGLDVFIGEVSDAAVTTVSSTTGTAENSGFLSVPEGNATIAGALVNQLGVIDSSTSVSLNGRIDLLASYNATINDSYAVQGGAPVLYNNTGTVNIGADSVMRILPEWNSSATVAAEALALNSIVSIIGANVEMGSDAIIEAPGASAVIEAGTSQQANAKSEFGTSIASGVAIQAGTWWNLGTQGSAFLYNNGQITMDSGAQVNVAGSTDVQVDSSQNFITLQLRGAELANSPLQQTSPERGQNIIIDARLTGTYTYDGVSYDWIGTPLGDATGYAALVERTVGQLTEQGGTVSLNAGSSVRMQGGSIINVSGGWTQYSGGKFSTTDMIYQGHLFNISQATPDRVYSGIFYGEADIQTFSKWGVKKVFESPLDPSLPHNETTYIQGANGGGISIQAPSEILNGNLIGNTVAGPRQMLNSSSQNSAEISTLPTTSSLILDIYGQTVINNVVDQVSLSSGAPSVTFAGTGSSSSSIVVLSPDLVSSEGFGNLTVLDHDGTITLPAGIALNAGMNGTVSLTAANIDIEGAIAAPGGSISLTADLAPYSVINGIGAMALRTQPINDILVNENTGDVVAQYGASVGGVTTVVNSDGTTSSIPTSQLEHLPAGIVTVGPRASISTAGMLVNDMPGSLERYQQPVAINGGTITISAYDVIMRKGGALDVSGGVLLPSTGSARYGNAGTIFLLGGQDPDLVDISNGSLQLGSTLKGYAGVNATTGTLSITAPAIQIGLSSSLAGVINLTPDFFNQGGFGNFNLTGIGFALPGSTTEFVPGIDIAPGTIIHPEVAALSIGSTEEGPDLKPFTPAAPYRAAANLSLTAAGLKDGALAQSGNSILIRGDLVMGAGSSITIDPQIVLSGNTATPETGSVTLAGNTVAVMGSIKVSGGAITIAGANSFPSNQNAPPAALITVDLAPSAILSTAGEAIYIHDPSGKRENFGDVLGGGTITVSGNILAEAGALLDASGASGQYDFFPYQLGVVNSLTGGGNLKAGTIAYDVQTSAGSIVLKGGQELYSDATLVALSGGSTAQGGSLSISSGRFYQAAEPNLATDLNLAVGQSGPSIPTGFQYSGAAAIAQAVPNSGNIPEGGGHIVVNSFVKGGFDNVTLSGNVIFNGPVTLSVPGSLKVATGGVLSADSTVGLTASYVALGTPFIAPLATGSSALTTVFGTSTSPLFAPPTYGTGQLNVTAQLIDIGNLSLQNIGSANLNAAPGVIRGDGTFDIAGNLVLNAKEIYPVSGVNFTVAAYNYNALSGAAMTSGGVAGSVIVESSGSPSLPLSAAGTLSFYAASITQGGVLLSPFGSINLGSASAGTAPKDPVSGLAVPTAQTLVLTSSSITSISGVNSLTGTTISVPFGTSPDGTTWNDPAGVDLTTIGLPGKSINLAAQNLVTQSGSLIDLQGGGNVTAYQWINGNGGTINLPGSPSAWYSSASYAAGDLVTYNNHVWSVRQPNAVTSTGPWWTEIPVPPSVGPYWTEVPTYYAVIPGYQPAYAPTGYADGSLGVGSQVVLAGGAGLSAGTYTLLPASYATQPGAYLINVSSSSPLAGSQVAPDGSVIVSGTRFNGLDTAVTAPKTTTFFQVLSPAAIAARVQYIVHSAGSFFSSIASSPSPANAGNLVLQANALMALNGTVTGKGADGGTGAAIDISVPGGIDITPDGTGGIAGDVVLGASQLSSWSCSSLLIGGLRGATQNGLTPVSVNAESISLEAGSALSGNDIIMTANGGVTLNSGASITASGSSTVQDENLTVNGNGVLLRVSSDPEVGLIRNGVSSQTAQKALPNTPTLTLGNGSSLTGSGLILDSSAAASIASFSQLNSKVVTINAGSISLLTDPSLTAANLDPSDVGSLLLYGSTLAGIENSAVLSLRSYSTLDFYGGGTFGSSALSSLSLHAGEIRGFDMAGSTLSVVSQNSILLDNGSGAASPGPVTAIPDGILEFDAATISVGAKTMAIDQFAHVSLNATGEVMGTTTTGSLAVGTAGVPTDLSVTTPLITGTGGSSLSLNASGALLLESPDASYVTPPNTLPGLGASLSLEGSFIYVDTTINLPSGKVIAEATGPVNAGDLIIGALGNAVIDVGGREQNLFDATRYTDAGSISFSSANGNIILTAGTTLNLSAQSGGGSAGTLSVSAPNGNFSIDPSATLEATGGTGGNNGTFFLDVGALPALSSISPSLGNAGFTQSLSFRVRTGDVAVDSYITSHNFSLSVDEGSIDVTPNGVINASGIAANGDGILTGGSISLIASGSLILEPNSELNVHADNYDAAGKGGLVFLSAGAEVNGSINPNAILDLQAASTIDLGVNATSVPIDAAGDSAQFGGVLHLRAPVTSDGTDIQINHLDSTITGASSIEVEGYRLYELSGSSADILGSVPIAVQGSAYAGNQTVQQLIPSDIADFYGSGVNSATASAILARLTLNQPTAVSNLINLAPGVEIINQSGGLTLSSQGGDWDLSTLRAGANSSPGFLTLRASGSVTLNASLSDGFVSSAYTAALLTQNPAISANFQSWSYQLTAGGDLMAADPTTVVAGTSENISLGRAVVGESISSVGGLSAQTADVLAGYYQVIRTGTGNVSLDASGNMQLLNEFASIYTVGVQVSDPTLGGTFDVPAPNFSGQQNTLLGAVQQAPVYPAQFSYAGGNITVNVGGNVMQLTLNSQNQLVPDSNRELPSNWLYRRGSVGADGYFQQMSYAAKLADIASTSWWVDFSNFFDDFGALGGGNIALNAAGNISDINVSIPTNYRMPGHAAGNTMAIAPNQANGVELGGGNLVVNAGGDISAGVFYVESGNGSLRAGGSITTDSTRDSEVPQTINPSSQVSAFQSDLPTTLFLGQGNFNIEAAGNVLLGPVANVFMTPQGVNNSFWYQNFFSTYASTDQVNVLSLGGNITFAEEAASPNSTKPLPFLQLWMAGFTAPANNQNISFYQPWLRLAESDISNLGPLLSVAPPTLNATALSGNINFQGNYTMMPSPEGNLSLMASGSVQGLQPAGGSLAQETASQEVWAAAQINLSDANPSAVPGISNPLSLRSTLTASNQSNASANATSSDFTASITALFNESGSYTGAYGSLQVQEALNDPTLLHASDSQPLQIYAQSGDISGLRLFSAKQANISAGGDITDVGLYIQNNTVQDVSIVSAGGSIVAWDSTSPLQQQAQAAYLLGASSYLQAGDIQISGPGTLEVLAGGKLDLGNGPNNTDGTGVGITSIGNQRNPALGSLPGADIIVEAGVQLPTGLSSSTGGLALAGFATTVLEGASGTTYLSELAGTMASSGDPLPTGGLTTASFEPGSTQLSNEEKARLDLQLFYIVLRDTGRNHNDPGSAGYGSYTSGEEAIRTFFGHSTSAGNNIETWFRSITTVNGGMIDIFAPGGDLALTSLASDSSLTPPGIITEGGGGIYIYTQGNVTIGTGRIFTLKGGDIMIWSDQGNIAAGSSSKTVQTAPPTQVLIDPQSGNVETDLAGLATGGGIGVLATVEGIAPGNVDLIAPSGVIDAGDAGIRSSGNISLAATRILNANNIAASGSTTGAPPAPPPPAAPNVGGATAASSASAANNSTAANATSNRDAVATEEQAPSIISVEVLGYGGGEGTDNSDGDDQQKKKSAGGKTPPAQAAL